MHLRPVPPSSWSQCRVAIKTSLCCSHAPHTHARKVEHRAAAGRGIGSQRGSCVGAAVSVAAPMTGSISQLAPSVGRARERLAAAWLRASAIVSRNVDRSRVCHLQVVVDGETWQMQSGVYKGNGKDTSHRPTVAVLVMYYSLPLTSQRPTGAVQGGTPAIPGHVSIALPRSDSCCGANLPRVTSIPALPG